MHFRLDHHGGEPIWRQIVEQVKYRIAAGQLAPNNQLPSIRLLASDLKINPRTVVKAYEELRHMGLVVMRQGQGVFVTDRRVDTTVAARRRILGDMSRRLLAEASRLGAESEEVMEIVKKMAEEMKHDR